MKDYIAINKATWKEKLDPHLASDFYNMEAFVDGKSSLNSFELALLGDVSGKKILHLQCHFGQDSISLSRMGAHVTAVDFSEKSIEKGRELAAQLGTSTQFICSDIYNLPNVLKEEFDIVFTTYGTIIWLPDVKKWANVVRRFTKPNGRLVFVDFHPIVWMYDDDFKQVRYKYSSPEAIVEEEEGTYANKNAPISTQCVTWNHGMASTINALINSGLSILDFQEYDYAPYPFVGGTEQFEQGKYRIKTFGDKVPLVYSVVAQNIK